MEAVGLGSAGERATSRVEAATIVEGLSESAVVARAIRAECPGAVRQWWVRPTTGTT